MQLVNFNPQPLEGLKNQVQAQDTTHASISEWADHHHPPPANSTKEWGPLTTWVVIADSSAKNQGNAENAGRWGAKHQLQGIKTRNKKKLPVGNMEDM